jgi:uncharacterized protein YwqG
MAFLAQINLRQFAQFPCAGVLPKEGWLVFFYDAEQSTWGFDPQDKGSWAVVFIPSAGAVLRRRGVPSGKLRNGFYKLCGVESHEIVTLQPWGSLAIDGLQLSRTETDAYLELDSIVYADAKISHQLLGYSQPIQSDMQLECQLVSHGLYCGNQTGYNDLRAKELAKGAGDWMLLFQLDTDDDAGMMWGDVGRLYFWVNRQDLAKRDFDKCWMILQCS